VLKLASSGLGFFIVGTGDVAGVFDLRTFGPEMIVAALDLFTAEAKRKEKGLVLKGVVLTRQFSARGPFSTPCATESFRRTGAKAEIGKAES
jgi:hypothetical protein